jgi:hypothetical protein
MNMVKSFSRKITVSVLLMTLMLSKLMALNIPGYLVGKIVNNAENAIYDSANNMITRPSVSIARAGSVYRDEAKAIEVLWASDVFGNYHMTSQANHLQGEIKVNGGFTPLDRRFSYHDWTYSEFEDDSLYDAPILGGTQRRAGNGLKVVVNDQDTYIGSGTIKLWDAYDILESDYSITGDDSLRQTTDKFNLRIHYKLADVNYSSDEGLTSVERSYPIIKRVEVSKVQKDKVSNIDLLKNNTEIVAGPLLEDFANVSGN